MKLSNPITVMTAMAVLSIAAVPASGEIKLQVRDGFPIVEGVYVDGHGPYRFLLDTGTNIDLIDAKLARSIGLTATFETDLVSSTGATRVPGGNGFEVTLDSARADQQQFLFVGMETVRQRWSDVQGVLGQAFLLRFDYLLDLRGKRFEIGKQDCGGTRARLTIVNGRPMVATSLGDLVLDSGASRLTLFGVAPQTSTSGNNLRTVSGSQAIGMVASTPLFIEERKILPGQTVAVPRATETGVGGLLPVSLFRGIYVSNSEGYVVFE